MTPVVHFQDSDMAANFPVRPFAIRHDLTGHPLFSLPRLIQLANSLDRDRIEYNSGDLEPGQRPEDTPKVGLPVDETIRRIEECHAWMVLKRVELDPDYRNLLDLCIKSLVDAAGPNAEPVLDVRGFIFISSANSVTPFHVDPEQNFLLQIRGEKFMHVFDNDDRSLVSDEALEIDHNRHRNLHYEESFEERATVFRMNPGDGVFVPYLAPHWVRTGDDYCVSIAVTWRTPEVLRQNKIRFADAMLRKVGLPQPGPGRSRVLDAVKVAAVDTAEMIATPLRQSERTRRLVRRIAFGRRANYYYEA